MTIRQPITRARGSVRPGSRTSSAANVTLFQADCEKKGPTMAAAAASANPNVVRDSDRAREKASSGDFHASDVPRSSPPRARASSAASFAAVKTFCVRVPARRPVMLVAVSSTTTPRAMSR